MADFKIAFERTEKFEGKNIWTKTPGDKGGETWSGISRVANPNWAGWKIIDSIPNKRNRQKIVNSRLEELKQQLYKKNYWDKVWGDKIKNQAIANDMYDTAVNIGVSMSIRLSERQFKFKETGKMSELLLNKLNSIL